jgi:hypothetical protein
MMRTLRNRVERLEQTRPKYSLDHLPDEVLERRFNLLAHMYMHGLAGLTVEEYRREHQAMGPLPLEPDPERPVDEKRLHERVILLLRADADRNAEYRRLLEMLSGTPRTVAYCIWRETNGSCG